MSAWKNLTTISTSYKIKFVLDKEINLVYESINCWHFGTP